MKNLVILGAGTGGTLVANRLRRRLPSDWSLKVVDPDPVHLYQPGLIFLPFGARDEDRIVRPRERTLRSGVEWVRRGVERVDTDRRRVVLGGGDAIPYDLLVIATGSRIRPEETPGLLGDHWQRSIFDFYTLEGAIALREALDRFEGGRIALNVVEMPIKCPVAPLEFLFLADAFFTKKGIRDRVDIVYATPLDGAFTKPIASRALSHLLAEKGIRVEAEFAASEVDGDAGILRSYDSREIGFDLLATVPTHGGAPMIETSGLGDELGFVPTHRHSLLAKGHDDVFVIGDATDLPTSKAGSVAHFQGEVVAENLMRAVRGESLVDGFDGHANCFVETGFGKALLIDFNYETEPLPGRFPLPGVGPFSLLEESRANHLGKLAFRPMYWSALLPGRPIPVTNRMTMWGKKRPKAPEPVQEAGGEYASA